jgi:hypothetical protein
MQSRQWLVGVVALAAFLAAAVLTMSRRGEDRDQEAVRLHEDCGAAMAKLAQQALGRGTRILVLEHDGSGFPPDKQEWMRSQIDAFYAAIGGGVQLDKRPVGSERAAREAEIRFRNADPLQLRAEGFRPLADRAPDADLIVSFVGEPIVGAGGPAAWRHLPPIVCYCLDGADVPALMEAGVVVSAIVPRRTPVSIQEAKSKSWFETMHHVVTPENVTEWAALE